MSQGEPLKTITTWKWTRPLLIAALASLLVGGAARASQPMVTLTGHVPAGIANAQAVEHVAGTTNIPLAFVLPLRNQDDLAAEIKRIYDPKSSEYRHFLTPTTFTAKYGPTQTDYDSLQRYATANGFTITGTSTNRLILDVAAPASTIERVLGLHLNLYNQAGTLVRYPDAEPKVPSYIATIISSIVGLDNARALRPHLVAQNPFSPGAVTSRGTGPGGGVSPTDIKTAYNLNGVAQDGTGQVMALFELDGYTTGDITAYENQFSLPHTTLQNVLVDGFNGVGSGGGGQAEVTLDIELMVAVAPHATKLMVYEAANQWQAIIDEYNKIATDNQAKTISSSWGLSELLVGSSIRNSENAIFMQMASQGQSIFAASGDSGAYDDGSTLSVDDPASQPYMCGVGGTRLSLSGSNYLSESAWNAGSGGGGGGISAVWAQPSFQTGHGTSSVMRNVPDVSLDADPNTGYSIYVGGGWNIYGGTSCAAPLWAAFATLVNQARIANSQSYLGLANTTIYTVANSSNYTSDFHDIHDNTTNKFYHAITGFDDATGWGSFNGANLLADMAGGVATSAPPVPSGVTATAASSSQINLAWSTSSGASSYKVFRGLHSGGPYTLIGSPSTTSYSDISLRPNTAYYYVVEAYGGGLTSADSSEVTATTTVPGPTGLKAKTNGSQEIDLAWMSTIGAQSYVIQRSTTSGSGYAVIGSSTTPSYQDTAVSSGTAYYYVVAAVNSGGNSPNSNEASGTTAPDAPSSLTATTFNASQINLSWSASTGATGYNVMRSVRQGGPYTKVALVTGSTTDSDLHLAASTAYYYVVAAVDAGGSGPNSPEATATTSPTAPGNVRAKANGSTEIDIAWTAVKGADSYNIKRGSHGGPYSLVGTSSSNTYADSGLTSATQYYYVVEAVNQGTPSADSSEVTATTSPDAPSNVTVTPGGASITVSWSASTGAATYGVYKSMVSGGPYVRCATAMSTSQAVSSLLPGVTYYFVVTAINSGGASPYSSEASGMPLTVAPAAVRAKTMGSAEIDLTWMPVKGASGYTVYRGTHTGGAYSQIGTASTNGYQDTGLTSSTQYFYVVTATNDGGASAQSGEATATTTPAVPSNVTPSVGGATSVSLTWSAVTGATSYMIWKSLNSGGPYVRSIGCQSASGTVTGLLPATTYYFVVSANNAGGQGDMSSEVSATTLPLTPTGLRAKTINSSEIDLTWTLPRGVTTFNIYRGTSTGVYQLLDSATGATYHDTSVSANTAYFYVVTGTANGQESTDSNEATTTTAPAPPGLVTATAASATQINLTWSAATGATSYNIWRSRVSGGPYTKIGTSGSTSYSSTGLATGTTYYYVVTSTGAGGTSEFSQEGSDTTQ